MNQFSARAVFACGAVWFLLAPTLIAQEVIKVGSGSYAATPPAHAGKDAMEIMARKPNVLNLGDRPVPTNQWWTNILVSQFTGELWPYPFKVSTDASGLTVGALNRWNDDGRVMIADVPLLVTGDNFKPAAAQACDWSDWTIQFRLGESADKYLDVTLGRGMPFVWIEPRGVQPIVTLAPEKLKEAAWFDRSGKTVKLPVTSDHIGIEIGGQFYGLFAPDQTQFSLTERGIAVQSKATKPFLVIGAMPKKSDLAMFYAHAFAVPRRTRLSWSYDPQAGQVKTSWAIDAEPLKGSETRIIQGWLPHHYRTTAPQFAFAGPEYSTPRGRMKTAIGNKFELVYRFSGLLPSLPAPAESGIHADASAARVRDCVARYSTKTQYGADTYWGGKDLLYLGQYLDMAHEIGDAASAEKLRASLRAALADWFTYTPGETEHYFAYYPTWKGLLGFKDSYGSAQFTDNHFHLGYFTYAATLLGMHDPEFLGQYSEMLRLVAKQYANWERDDARFPFLRTFDPWAGHSHAGGLSSPGGNNQESTSEAMQSWGGLFLLGSMLDDQAMRDAGAMGYAMESQASLEYWLNQHGDNFPPQYKRSIVGILFDAGNAYATYFSGDPAWIHGIQWLPVSPLLGYLAEDPKFAKLEFERAMAEREKQEGTRSISKMGTALGNVILGFELQFDPQHVIKQLDEMWDANDPVARENYTAGISYFFARANRALGTPATDVHLTIPTSRVYFDVAAHTYSYVAFNPKPYPQWADAIRAGTSTGGFLVLPGRLVVQKTLQPVPQQPAVMGSYPANQQKDVSRFIDTIYVTFSEPVDAATLKALSMEGPGLVVERIQASADPRIATVRLKGSAEPAASYRLIVPTSVRTVKGAPAVASAAAISFVIEKQPPLAMTASSIVNGQQRVPLETRSLRLTFNAPMDPASLKAIRVIGAGVTSTSATTTPDNKQAVTVAIAGRLEPDQYYTLQIPTAVQSIRGDRASQDIKVVFSSAPSPCPPNIYMESFAGGAVLKDEGITVDLASPQSPHSGKVAIKITGGSKEGAVTFCAGKDDKGDGRTPLDLSKYAHVELWLKGDASDVWLKVGHPVFDHGAFTQIHFTKLTNKYQRVTIDLPQPKNEINTLLSISVPAGKTLEMDDIRFTAEK